MKKKYYKIQLTNLKELYETAILELKTRRKHSGLLKHTEKQLILATKMNEQKDLEIQKLHTQLLANRILPHIENAVSEMNEIEKETTSIKLVQVGTTSGKTSIPFIQNHDGDFICNIQGDDFGKIFCIVDGKFELKKLVVEPPTNFSSRFMPNVKFEIKRKFGKKYVGANCNDISHFTLYFGVKASVFESGWYYTSKCGEKIKEVSEFEWSTISKMEVSKFEAVPELVPEGMVYDKKSDSLVRGIMIDLTKPVEEFKLPENEMVGEIEKEVVDAPTNFSSRFMPNVKFKVTEEEVIWIYDYFLKKKCFGLRNAAECWVETDETGKLFALNRDEGDCNKKTVSKYEAIPELVPDGMVYDKKTNSLVSDKEAKLFENIINFGTDYHPDDVAFKDIDKIIEDFGEKLSIRIKDDAFKVIEVISLCDSCVEKKNCLWLSKLKNLPVVTECPRYEAIKSDNFIVLTDTSGKEFAVLKEVWDSMLEKGSVLVGKIP